jgi:tetraacyldisaccharide 4'-kinase
MNSPNAKKTIAPLSPLAAIYGRIMTLRNVLYDHNYLKTHWLDAPTIAVGNITTGGTGKTPTVVFLAKLLRDLGSRPGIIMRGYGSKPGQDGDEVLMLRRVLPDVPVVANPDRIIAGRSALEQGADVIIADDAFQHRRLGRDLNLCLIDAVSPFGGEKNLPAGHLREPLAGLNRADIFIITRSDQVAPEALDQIRYRLNHFATNVPILTSSHRPCSLSDLAGHESSAETLAGRKIVAFAAIGRPDAFFKTLKSLGAQVLAERAFRDHHRFTLADLIALRDAAKNVHADALVCTAKDLVKFTPAMLRDAEMPADFLFSLDIEITLSNEDREQLTKKINAIIANFDRKILTNIK